MTPIDTDATSTWELRAASVTPQAIPPHRPVPVGELAGYVEPLGVRPGEPLRVHLSAPAAYSVEILRLGRSAILDPQVDDAADRAEAMSLGRVDVEEASAQTIHPGSYAWVDAAAPARPSTIAAWVRPWRLPSVVETWAWAAIVSDFDFHDRCHWALGLDVEGRLGCYFGDGGAQRREWWTMMSTPITHELGSWMHVACVADGEHVVLYVDGARVATGLAAGASTPAEGARVRIGAAAEQGVADNLLDADVSALALFDSPLRHDQVQLLVEDRGRSAPTALGLDDVAAYWPLRERGGDRLVDAGGGALDARLVNGATLNLPGPSSSIAAGGRAYDPVADPFRGGAVRFSIDDLRDCRWPAAVEVTVPEDADSGTYAVSVTLAGATTSLELPFIVVRAKPRRPRSVALLYATFTWAAYARRPIDDVVVPGFTSSYYSDHLNGRPHFHVGFRVPLPRVKPFMHDTHRHAATLHQHLVRPERLAEAWLEREGYAYECITDADLDRDPELLEQFSALMIVGHNEYWSTRMRQGVDAYVDAGGAVVCLSGNTAFWRVTFDQDEQTLESRKTVGAGEGSNWLPPDLWGERWHSDGAPGGKWSLVEPAPHRLLGLETIGWVDSGDPLAFAPFTVLAPDHPLFNEPEPVPLSDVDTVGNSAVNGTAVSGYEMDGLPESIGMATRGPTDGLVLLAHAQHEGDRYIGTASNDPGYGADMVYWERPGGGRVFNAATINYTGSLAVDPGVQALTRNVLAHFGVAKET